MSVSAKLSGTFRSEPVAELLVANFFRGMMRGRKILLCLSESYYCSPHFNFEKFFDSVRKYSGVRFWSDEGNFDGSGGGGGGGTLH